MKRKEKTALYKIILFFSVWLFFSMLSFYYLLQNFQNPLFAFLAIFIFSLVGAYFIAEFSLFPLFEATKSLDRLLKDTLHELNIPIATIKANVSMLKKREKDFKNIKRLNRIEEACDKLFSLYQDVDYLIKKEMNLSYKETFEAKEIILNSLKHFEDITKDIKIESDLEECLIFADKRGFVKVVDNLLSNALKYNKKGGFIKVSLKNCLLSVEDSGIGMDEEEIFRIFDRYYQSDSKMQGYGIGLSIIKSYCDENFIPLHITSKKGVGTKIVLELSKLKV